MVMREAFARWALPDVTHVTRSPSEGLQEINNDISDVTLVTHVTLKKQQAQLCMGAGSVPVVEPDLSKNRVTKVTRVTCHESLDNSCNPTQGTRVTGLQGQPAALLAEAQGWPLLAQRAAVALAAHHQAQSHGHDDALMLACRAVREALAQGGDVAEALTAEPPQPPMPPEAQTEVNTTTTRLVAGGWGLSKARLLAPALVARGLGLPEPPEPDLPKVALAALLAGLPVGAVAQ